jgi:hypothetical protein
MNISASLVYLLCAITSTLCVVLLVAKYRSSRVRLLLWCSLCFSGLALNNIVLFVDLVLTPASLDLSVVRALPAVLGVSLLLYGFIWDVA